LPIDAVPIRRIEVSAYVVPTDAPEEDGTFASDGTTLVVVEIEAGAKTGLGYSYSSVASAAVIRDLLGPRILQQDAFAIPRHWQVMLQAVRNIGSRGICASAIAAVDVALWDVKARVLDTPLARLLGMARENVPIYGSGGFTNYDDGRLADQLGRWANNDGCRWVKMKVGRRPLVDVGRMRAARNAIGDCQLMIDANGALDRFSRLRQL